MPASLKNEIPLSKSCLPVTNRFRRRTSGLIEIGYCDCWLSRRLASAPEVALLPDCTQMPSAMVAPQPLLPIGCTWKAPAAVVNQVPFCDTRGPTAVKLPHGLLVLRLSTPASPANGVPAKSAARLPLRVQSWSSEFSPVVL